MEFGLEIDDDNETKGGMWVLDQKLDLAMDEDAIRLRNMYRDSDIFCSTGQRWMNEKKLHSILVHQVYLMSWCSILDG